MAAGPWCRTGEAAGRRTEEKEGLAGGLQFLVERKEASAGQRETQRQQTEVNEAAQGLSRQKVCKCPWHSHPQEPACPLPQRVLLIRMSECLSALVREPAQEVLLHLRRFLTAIGSRSTTHRELAMTPLSSAPVHPPIITLENKEPPQA